MSQTNVVMQRRRTPTRRNPPRRAKRQRLESYPLGLSTLHFDILSDECLENIFRHLSRKPRSDPWERFVSADTLLSLVRLGGVLTDATRTIFTDLRDICTREVQLVRLPARHGGFHLDLISNPAYGLIPGLGPTMRKLHIDVAPDARLVRLIKAHCGGLRALSVIYDGSGFSSLRTLLKSVGRQLESLEIEVVQLYTADIAAMAEHCTKLKHLKFSTEKLKVSLAPLWRSVAENLQCLEITLPNQCDSIALDVAAKYCPNISSLTFDNFLDEQIDEIISMCQVYGPRLQLVRLLSTKLDEDDLRLICAACPNVSIDMRDVFSIGLFNVPCMLAMGPAAKTMLICEAEEGDDEIVDNLEQIGSACPNLRRIETNMGNIPVPALSSLFVTPKPKFVKFIAKVDGGGPAPESIFRVLTENSSTLEHFKYDGPVPPLELLAPFVAATRRLRKVKLVLDFPERCPCKREAVVAGAHEVFKWSPIVKAFLQSESIVDLVCECRIRPSIHGYTRLEGEMCSKLANTCVPVRATGISVYICGNRYV